MSKNNYTRVIKASETYAIPDVTFVSFPLSIKKLVLKIIIIGDCYFNLVLKYKNSIIIFLLHIC